MRNEEICFSNWQQRAEVMDMESSITLFFFFVLVKFAGKLLLKAKMNVCEMVNGEMGITVSASETGPASSSQTLSFPQSNLPTIYNQSDDIFSCNLLTRKKVKSANFSLIQNSNVLSNPSLARSMAAKMHRHLHPPYAICMRVTQAILLLKRNMILFRFFFSFFFRSYQLLLIIFTLSNHRRLLMVVAGYGSIHGIKPENDARARKLHSSFNVKPINI